MLFCRLFYLTYAKYSNQDDEFMTENDYLALNDFEKSEKNILIFTPEDEDYEEDQEEEEEEY